VVRPAVIGTRERTRVAAVGGAHHRAAVHAPVDEHGDRAVGAAHHDDGLGADAARDVVARSRNLAVVADEDPAAPEDALHLFFEDAWIGVERGVDAIVLHERLVVERRREQGRGHFVYSITSSLPLRPSGTGARARRTDRASPPP